MQSNKSRLRGTRVALFGAAVAVVLTLGCPVTKPPPIAECDHPITDQDRTAALVSVYANAYFDAGLLPGGYTPQTLGVQSLSDAVRTLKCDSGPLAEARKRRAVAKLAAYSRGNDPSAKAWPALAGDPDLIAKVAAVLRTAPAEPPIRESVIFDVAAPLVAALCRIVSDVAFQGPELGKDSGEVSWEVSFTVNRNVDWLAPRLDPQNWDQCSPFFPATLYTQDVPPHVSTCPVPTPPTPSENDPKPPGSAPYSATLFEDFECTACDTVAKNLLGITARAGSRCQSGTNPCDSTGLQPSPAYQICYGLDCSTKTLCGDGATNCCSNALYFCAGTPVEHVDLLTDHGELTACNLASGAGLRAIVRKTVKLYPPSKNLQTFILYYFGQQAAIDGFIDITCCYLH